MSKNDAMEEVDLNNRRRKVVVTYLQKLVGSFHNLDLFAPIVDLGFTHSN